MTNPGENQSAMQERIFAFLTDPARRARVERIDTHAASVILEGDRVLKIKRAVRFPFLDYSTLEKRKSACAQEIEINRQFAPQIYRRVVAITQAADGSFSIDGCGTPVEYAVEMARFDERKTLDHLAKSGPLGPDLIEEIAETIASSHLKAAAAPAAPWPHSIPKIIGDYINGFRAFGFFPADRVEELGVTSHAAFDRARDLLERRKTEGYVRRCHGDLHLANIVVIDEKPVLFDAIEFDEDIASTDVLYDLAFTLTDLLHYDRRDAANWLFNRYLSISPADNLNVLSALPLLVSMRAAIRAHVLAARLGRVARGREAILAEARAYFDLAARLIKPPRPVLIAVGGLSGTGKSVLARSLACDILPEPGAIILRSDVLRKQMFGVAERDKLPESAYGLEANADVYGSLARCADRVVSQGHAAIADAVFARESERAAFLDIARKAHIRFVGLFLVTDLKTRQARIAQRGADASDASPELAREQEHYDLGSIDWAMIDASGTPEATLQACRARIAEFAG